MDTTVTDTLVAPSPACETLTSNHSVHLEHCNISEYSPQLMPYFPNSLVSISIIFSSLRTFPGEFSQLPALQYLDLHGNKIEALGNRSGTFGNLIFLDLSYNNIKFLEYGFFSTIKHVGNLNLSHNELRTVDVELYGFMTNWDSRRLIWIVDVDLSHNQIVKATTHNFDLYFSSNYHVFHGILNLTFNNITLISDILFSWWQRPLSYILNGRLYEAVTSNTPPEDRIEILWDDNPLMLDCVDCMIYRVSGSVERDKLNTSQLIDRYASYEDLEYMRTADEDESMMCKLKDIDCPNNCVCQLYGCSLILILFCNYLSDLPLNVTNNILQSYSFNPNFYLTFSLYIENSEIHDIFQKEYFAYVNGLHVRNSSITNIEREAFLLLSISIVDLDISDNMLKTLPEEVHWPNLQNLHTQNNPWHCDCNILWMKVWIINYADAIVQRETFCASPFYNAGHQLSTLPNWRFICLSTIIGITVSVVMLFTVIVSSVLVYKWRFWLYQKYGFHPFDKDECDNEDKKFDVFVSYSNDDYEWARELMAELEKLGFRVCCHEGDFLAGTTISENVARAVHFSKRTLCIVSRAFMASSICMHEFITARSFDFSYKKARLLVIMNEDIATDDLHEDIRMYVKSFTYLKRDCPFFMKRLLYRLPLKKLGNDENTPLLIDTHV